MWRFGLVVSTLQHGMLMCRNCSWQLQHSREAKWKHISELDVMQFLREPVRGKERDREREWEEQSV